MQAQFDSTTQKNLDRWLNGAYDESTKAEIRRLMQENPKEALDSFYQTLSFGTGGLRGVMGVGANRMNIYTIRSATQGLASTICQQPAPHAVFIGFDSRNHSRRFAEETAKVLAGNGIHVYLCRNLRPTPYISFGVRFKKCQAGINITASHNPPEYNGYKVYWADGGQVVPPHDQQIIDEVNKTTDLNMIKIVDSLNHPLIEYVEEEVDRAYLDALKPLALYPEDNKKHGDQLHIVYTSLHGTGITLIPQAFENWGFHTLSLVEKQVIPDGNFPTVNYPNPEEIKALQMGTEVLEQKRADILIATDPDADRVGVVARHKGKSVRLNGNQVACICLEHVCSALTTQNKLPERPAFIKTIVTTELFQTIADHYQIPSFNVLTGFKYIAEKIHQWENDPNGYQFIFGGEESYGYLLGTQTRDKDAIISSMLICEVALQAKLKGKTLIDLLDDLYEKYGVFTEKLLSLMFEESKEGRQKMAEGIKKIQASPPKKILDTEVVMVEDYEKSLKTDLQTKKTEPLTLPKSNVLTFWLKDQTKLTIRPSGTEPKIKIYCEVRKKLNGSIEETIAKCNSLANQYAETLSKYVQE